MQFPRISLSRIWRTTLAVSLLEVMITVGVAGISTMGIVGMVYANNVHQFRTEQRTAAYLLAEQIMEESRRLPFSALAERTERVQPFSRLKRGNQDQDAIAIIRLFDDQGNRVPNGPPTETYSFLRVEVEVSFLPRSQSATTVTLVSWMVP
jgi:hypothetical protein